MITVRKLTSLPVDLRLRKIRRLCSQWRKLIKENGIETLVFYRVYIRDVLALTTSSITELSPESDKEQILDTTLLSWLSGDIIDSQNIIRSFWNLEKRIEQQLGEEAVDWDFDISPDLESNDPLPAAVYVEDIRSPFNLGAVFRTSSAFGFSKVYISPGTPSPLHPRAERSAMGTVETMPWKVCTLKEAEADFGVSIEDSGVFGLETGGVSIDDFSFPDKGIVVLGSEEMGIHPDTLRDLGKNRVSIPLYGSKGSLNVGVAFGILARYWASSLYR